MPVSRARYELLRTRVERFTRLLHEIEHGNAVAVHRTRVASRRLREVLPVLQLDGAATRKLARRLRHVTRRLGAVRELDVMLASVADLRASGDYPDAALHAVTAAVSDARARAGARLAARLPVGEFRRLAVRLEKLVASLDGADDRPAKAGAESRSWRWAIDVRVAKRAERLGAAVSAAGTMYAAERLHAVRIAAKKLRYAVEVCADVSPRGFVLDLKRLRRVQNILGQLHDRQVLADRVRAVQASLTPPDITIWRGLDAVLASLEGECRRLHGRYMHEREGLVALSASRVTRAPTPSAAVDKPRPKRSVR